MTITSFSFQRVRDLVTVTVVSDLSGEIFYHWYLDGVWQGFTSSPERSFYLDADEQARVDVNDTTDPDYDGVANAPVGWPSRRTLFWTRSVDADTASYKVEQNKDSAGWTEIGTKLQEGEEWQHFFRTPVLTDLSSYEWRVTPVDILGNEGTSIQLDSEKVVRRPDAPDYTISFDPTPDEVTFTAA